MAAMAAAIFGSIRTMTGNRAPIRRASHGVPLPHPASAAISPYDILRFILTACPQLCTGSALR